MQWLARLALLGSVGLLLAGARGASAQVPPARVFGTVTVNGVTPPPGTRVEAIMGDQVCGEGVVRELGGEIGVGYVVDVRNETLQPGCGADGRTITFRVGGQVAPQTAVYEVGSFIRLDLMLSGAVETPPPGPTPPPFGAAAQPTPTPEAPPATPTATPGAALTPTPTPATEASPTPSPTPAASPAGTPGTTATASPTGTAPPAAAITPTGTVITVSPPGATQDEDGGVPVVVWLVLVVAAAAAAGAAIYLYVRSSRGA